MCLRARAWMVVGLAELLAFPFSSWDRTRPIATFRTDQPAGEAVPGAVFPDPWRSWEAGSGGWYWRRHHLAKLCLLPDMRVMIDGQESAFRIDEATGLVVHDLEAGTSRVELEWRAFPALARARLASLVSLG